MKMKADAPTAMLLTRKCDVCAEPSDYLVLGTISAYQELCNRHFRGASPADKPLKHTFSNGGKGVVFRK